MIFSYNLIQSFLNRKIPKPEKLAELLTMHSFEIEEVKKAGRDSVLDIDVLANRGPDCFSHIGIAREIAAILSFKVQELSCKLKEDKKLKTKDFIKVKIENKEDCFRYTARVLSGVKVGPSPKWIQEKLKVCGLRSINNIVDATNYAMLETGQPLHAFDFEKMAKGVKSSRTKEIIVRRAQKKEKIVTLDNEKYDLNKDILVIADSQGPLAIAGIKGGEKAEITKKTKIIVLESANFNPQITRRASKRLKLKTDASWRFEHGIDPNLTEIAIKRAAGLIQEIAGGEIAESLADEYPKKSLPKKIKLDLKYVDSLLGIKIPEQEVKSILRRLGFKYSGSKEISVEIPTFRLDISMPEDLIEEIGRVSGYGKIKNVFPVASLIPPKRNEMLFWENIAKNTLKECGFTEVYNYSFVGNGKNDISLDLSLNYWDKEKIIEMIEMENPLSLDFQYLRPSLIPNLIKNIQKNQKNFKKIKIFELGKIFGKPIKKIPNKKQKIIERLALTGLVYSSKGSKKELFYELKGIIDVLLNRLGISNIYYDSYGIGPESAKFLPWDFRNSAEIRINNDKVGFLGEVSEKIFKRLKIEKEVFLFDLDFEKISKLVSEEKEYRPISRYPAAVRDLAILVPRKVLIEEALNKINIAGGDLVFNIDLFDIYEGEELPQGKKNLAFHIIYQARDRTLSSKEIDNIHTKIINNLEENEEWQVRR
ncbi:phenylalanine--tRNA ligase subunit beta [Patescibacteria group bacterium]